MISYINAQHNPIVSYKAIRYTMHRPSLNG